MTIPNRTEHIRLTSHPEPGAKLRFPIEWGAATARERGPIIGTVSHPQDRNVDRQPWRLLFGLSRARGFVRRARSDPPPRSHQYLSRSEYRSRLRNGPSPSASFRSIRGVIWSRRISRRKSPKASISGPTIAITRARLDLPEMQAALKAKRLKNDGEVVHDNGSISVVKIAIDPVWYLPGIAERFGTTENSLRRVLFEQTAGMFPELVTRPDLQVFLPPIGGATIYLFGDVDKLTNPRTQITCRVHDECNGSDVFGSDICTCRPYLIHGIEECARSAQNGGLGVIIYNRKEGRALGEVTKFLVYNARKRQEGGDAASAYFERTECVAGVQDARFQQLMPDVGALARLEAHRPLRVDERHEI